MDSVYIGRYTQSNQQADHRVDYLLYLLLSYQPTYGVLSNLPTEIRTKGHMDRPEGAACLLAGSFSLVVIFTSWDKQIKEVRARIEEEGIYRHE